MKMSIEEIEIELNIDKFMETISFFANDWNPQRIPVHSLEKYKQEDYANLLNLFFNLGTILFYLVKLNEHNSPKLIDLLTNFDRFFEGSYKIIEKKGEA